MLAQKQKTELKDMPMPEAFSAVEHVVEIKSNANSFQGLEADNPVFTNTPSPCSAIIIWGGNGGVWWRWR